MITAFYTPYYKFLQKGNYLKFFDEITSLRELIGKIKSKETIMLYARSKDIIKFQFGGTDFEIEYVFLRDNECFESFENQGNRVKVKVKDPYCSWLGEYIYFVQDRAEQIKLVNELDVCALQATDVNNLVKVLSESNALTPLLIHKMFFTDNEIKEMGVA